MNPYQQPDLLPHPVTIVSILLHSTILFLDCIISCLKSASSWPEINIKLQF